MRRGSRPAPLLFLLGLGGLLFLHPRAHSRSKVRTGRLTQVKPVRAVRPGTMVTVTGGWFYKGSTTREIQQALRRFGKQEVRGIRIRRVLSFLLLEEVPRRKINVSTFRIDRYEVTRGEYRKCVRAGHCSSVAQPSSLGAFRHKGAPMINVTWFQASRYCAWKGRRLPTEAEWEKAARGPLARIWPWGNRWNERATNHGTIHPVQPLYHGSRTDGFYWIAPIGRFPFDRSYYSVYDLGGNAAEWVADWYRPRHWATAKVSRHDPKGPPGGNGRLVKGGSWRMLRIRSRPAAKRFMEPRKRAPDIGFRCAQTVKARKTPLPRRR